MARKPNYRFDRMDKVAAKKAERLKAKRERSAKGAKDSKMPDARPEPNEG